MTAPTAPGTDTVFAPASGFGRAAICVVRVSGPGTRRVLEALAGGPPPPRRLALRTLRDPTNGEALDRALVAFFPAPHSFTGEDQAELHVHGGLATRTGVLEALARLPGCRPAEPGEFTRRAFLAGRMDLSAVEGLADLIEAQTQAQRRQALRQLEGGLGALADAWRGRLVETQALLEAALDFSDEGDVAASVEAQAAERIAALAHEIAAALADAGRGERLREGYVVVLAGPPNAGKSTLMNALARRDVAIVSAVPGTTRDAIEVRLDLGGLPVTLIDTAGLRETQDAIEAEGVARTRARIAGADLLVWLDPVDAPAAPEAGGAPLLHVRAKSDLADDAPAADARGALALSATTGAGIADLLAAIEDRARGTVGDGGDAVVTRARHRIALERAREALDRAAATLAAGETELAAEDVRLAARAVGTIAGRVDVEDVLDALFGAFCIGK
ncbi:tRNA uridine-5-carboxymethylaminomethyl(34) synthesis GTPase MnmE [Salinarimonas rosea]|uniref:tRNA uridine-5-carboxymethylaminomethyl(34) synthesis GTPase MnmE n=1 Tax=Salinarimonas rosea TaxID=552063 RepID=UPI000405DC80|nr:tRNA uridine-5-carboxymethylaminomethyl(34) synthesis GTPase MnmE [Salinarimonas rosea]